MDIRPTKTKVALKNALIAFLKKKPVNQITVSEVAKAANVGRGTFYLHYRDIFDLYDDLVNDLYREMELFFDQAYPSGDDSNLMHLINLLTTYIEQEKELFLLLNRPEDHGKTFRKFKELFTKKVLFEEHPVNDSEYDAVESMFIVSGVIGVLEDWLMDGIQIPQKSLAAHLHRLVGKF